MTKKQPIPQSVTPKQLAKLEKQLTKCGFNKEAQAVRTIQGGSPADAETARIWGLSAYSPSGVRVTEQSIQNTATAYSCVSIRAQTLAMLPIGCFRRSGTDRQDRELADQHPAHWLWNQSPDDFMNSFNVREAGQAHILMRGNTYFEIGRNFRGQAIKAWLLDPRRMHIEYPTGYDAIDTARSSPGFPLYRYDEPSRPQEKFDRSEVMHVAGWSQDGLEGQPPLTMFRDALGLAIAADNYTSEYFRKGGAPMGFLSKPNVLSKLQRDSLRDEWRELHAGIENAHQVGILSGGLEWKNIGFNNNDSQLLGLRNFQNKLINAIFRVPPFLTGDTEQSIDKMEWLMIQYVIFTVLPDMRRWENELNRSMFTPKERFTYFMEHDPTIMLKGDTEGQAKLDEIHLRNGIRNINEIRHSHNWNSIPNGDKYLVIASQLATLDDVVSGKANLDTTNKTNSSGNAKTATPEKQINRIAKAYQKLSEADRLKTKAILMNMNGQGTLTSLKFNE